MATKAAKQDASKPKRKQRGPGRRFQPGESGNPKGRPPVGKSLAEAVRRVGDEVVDRGKYKGQPRVDVLIRALFAQGTKGNARAAAVLLDRGWGKAPQPIVGDDGGEILIRLIRDPLPDGPQRPDLPE